MSDQKKNVEEFTKMPVTRAIAQKESKVNNAPSSPEENVSNPTKGTPAKQKSQKPNKKKAAAERKAIENQIKLKGIAAEILRHKTQAEHHKTQECYSYLEMGRLLLEAKSEVKMKRDAWLSWLSDNFDMSFRTAQKLMSTYKTLGDTQALSHLGYTKVSMLATLIPDKRDEFLSKQQHEVKDGEFKSAEEMTTREFEGAVRGHKESKPRTVPQKVSVSSFSKKLSSLGIQLDDVVSCLSKIDGDAAESCKKLYTELCELLKVNASKLSDQPSERTPSDVPTVSNEPNRQAS